MTSDSIESVETETYLLVSTRGWRRSTRRILLDRAGSTQLKEVLLREWRSDQWIPFDHSSEWIHHTGHTGDSLIVYRDSGFPDDLLQPPDDLGPYPTEKRARYGDFLALAEAREPRPRTEGWSYPWPTFSADLQRDRSAILKRFLNGHPDSHSEGVVRALNEVLKTCLQPSWMRDALVTEVSQLPQVERVPSVLNLDETERFGLQSRTQSGLHTILFDKDTGQYAGYAHHATSLDADLRRLSKDVLKYMMVDVSVVNRVEGLTY